MSLALSGWTVRGHGAFVLGPLSLSLPDGALLCVLGAAGSGKTLLLASLASLVHARGERSFRGAVALQFQRDALVDDESAFENVAAACRAREHDDADARAAAALAQVGLGGKEHALPRMLSGGQRRRVGLARALAVDAPLLLLDDPTAGLDPRTADEVSALFRPTPGRITVLATHDVDALARSATHMLLLDRGRAVHFWARHDDVLPPEVPERYAAFAPRPQRELSW